MFFVPLLATFSVEAQGGATQNNSNYYDFGIGGGASVTRGYSNVAKQHNNPASDLSLIYPSILAEAKNGDPLAIKLISEGGYYIGQGIAVLIPTMNPQSIVLTGKGSEAGKAWVAPIQQALNELCIPALLDNTEVILSPLGSNARLIGAAALVVENIAN